MMSINWGVLVVVAITLLVLAVLAVTAVMYIRHWASRHEVKDVEPGIGKYFKRYVDEREKAIYKANQNIALERKQSSLRRIKLGMMSAFIAVAVLGTAASLYMNRDTLVSRVTLDDLELNEIQNVEHQWTRVYPEQLLDLKQQLEKMKTRGIILVQNSAEDSSKQLESLKKDSFYSWKRFAENHRIAALSCEWNELSSCQQQFRDWLFVVMPDRWDPRQINWMVKTGMSVLLYDAPFQVVDKSNPQPFSIYDLTFEPTLDQSDSVLALAGDKELTLGFDAGTILEVRSNSPAYLVHSDKPQALAIDSNHIAGAEQKTRLYAHSKGKGRLVWMDFSPNLDVHGNSGLNPTHFEALLASIFRYLNKESYQSIANWPHGKSFAALIEEDTEDSYKQARRVAEFFAERNYPITWFVLSSEAERNRSLTRFLAETGEIACHGDNHQPFTQNDGRTQLERLALCRKAINVITEREVSSFRPPEEKFSAKTLDALANLGFDNLIAERGLDRFVPIIMRSQQTGKELVSLPRMVLDDYVLWHQMEADFSLSKRLTAQQIDYVEALGGLYMFSFHTQYMEDDDNLAVVKFIADQVHHKHAHFATTREIANWWKFRSRLMSGKAVHPKDVVAFTPVIMQVDQYGNLISKPYTSMRTASK